MVKLKLAMVGKTIERCHLEEKKPKENTRVDGEILGMMIKVYTSH